VESAVSLAVAVHPVHTYERVSDGELGHSAPRGIQRNDSSGHSEVGGKQRSAEKMDALLEFGSFVISVP
jgi:hypothetical protein